MGFFWQLQEKQLSPETGRSSRVRTAGGGSTALTHLPELVEFGEVGDGQQVDVDHAEKLQVLEI